MNEDKEKMQILYIEVYTSIINNTNDSDIARNKANLAVKHFQSDIVSLEIETDM